MGGTNQVKKSNQITIEDEVWTKVIEPQGDIFKLNLSELWQYRDLILLFVRRDFIAQYKQTILGPAWHLIQPLLTTLMFTVVFGQIAKISTEGISPFLFYLSGTVIWTYFAAVLTATSNTFVSNAGIFGKVYFPRLAVPVANLISKFISFTIQFLLFLCFLGWFKLSSEQVHPNSWVFLTPLLLVMMAALGLGLGIIVSAMTTRYRDLTVLVGFGVQLLMYASPIIYPLSILPEKWQFWASLNPIAPIVETFRYAYLGTGSVSILQLSISLLTIAIILYIGIILFNRVERNFIDTV